MKKQIFALIVVVAFGMSAGFGYYLGSQLYPASAYAEMVDELAHEVQKLQHDLEREQSRLRKLLETAKKLSEVETAGSPVVIAAQIIDSCERWGVDSELVLALGLAESGWDVYAQGRAGEVGPLQVMPGTLKILRPGTDPADWQITLDAGVEYLARCLQRANGDIRLALAFYNAGSSRGPECALRLASRHVYRVMQYRRNL